MVVVCQFLNKTSYSQTIYHKDLIGVKWGPCYFYTATTDFNFNIRFIDSLHLEMEILPMNISTIKADYFIENSNGLSIIRINGINQVKAKIQIAFLAKLQNTDTLKLQSYEVYNKNYWDKFETRFNTGIFIRHE